MEVHGSSFMRLAKRLCQLQMRGTLLVSGLPVWGLRDVGQGRTMLLRVRCRRLDIILPVVLEVQHSNIKKKSMFLSPL